MDNIAKLLGNNARTHVQLIDLEGAAAPRYEEEKGPRIREKMIDV